MRLCAIVWLVVTYCSCSAESVISGPFPQNVTARINSTVEFTCSVNTSELTAGTFSLFGWNKDGVATSKTSGVVKSSTLTLTVTEENLSGVPIQCRVILEPLSQILSGNATLITYGPPQAISNLTTKPVTQSSSNALILSWSAPSSPVQLHYTVTVRLTNTNSTSTTTITMFNTSSTTITISRDNITGNSTECDIYTFSVTAINLAGSSLPANTITPVSFVPSAPVGGTFNVSSYTNNSLLVSLKDVQCLLGDANFSIVLSTICSSQSDSIVQLVPINGSVQYILPVSHSWTNITIIVENQYGILSHTVNINQTVPCPTSVSAVNTMSVGHGNSQLTVSAHSSATPSPVPLGQPVGVIVAAGSAILLLLIGLLAFIVIIITAVAIARRSRERRENGVTGTNMVHVISMTSNENQTPHEQTEESTPSPLSKLPEYMTPADARKEADIIKQADLQQSHSQESSHSQGVSTGGGILDDGVKVVDTGHYSTVWNNKLNQAGKNTKRHSSYSYRMTRPTVSPPQRSFSQASSGSISVEPLTVPPADRTHSPLVPSPRASSTTSSEYKNISTVRSGGATPPQLSSHYNHLRPSPSSTSSGDKTASVFTYSSQESNHLLPPLPGEEPLPSPTLAHSDGSQASHSSSGRASAVPKLPVTNESPLVEDSTTPPPRPSSQYTDTTQPLPPLPGEQDDQPYSSQYAHYHADPSLSYDHTHITSSTDQQSPQPDSAWYLN